jgi:hypothetical protein
MNPIELFSDDFPNQLMPRSSFRCDQIFKYELYDFGHTVVLLKSDLDVQQTRLSFAAPEVGLLNIQVRLK